MRSTAVLGGLAVAIGASAAALHPMAAVGIVLGVAAVIWILSNALNATLAFIVVLVLRPADHFPALATMQPAKVVAVVAILSLVVTKLFHSDMRLSRAPQGKWMLALAGGVLLSSILSTHPSASLELFADATSLGGVESLVEWRGQVEGGASSVPEDLVRLSIGIEAPDDLITDLRLALETA